MILTESLERTRSTNFLALFNKTEHVALFNYRCLDTAVINQNFFHGEIEFRLIRKMLARIHVTFRRVYRTYFTQLTKLRGTHSFLRS